MSRENRAAEWKPEEDEAASWSERLSAEFDWAGKHLPDEHQGCAVVAMVAIRCQRRKVSTKSVMERLEASGRTARQLRERGWM